jgi:hypothetical protein
MNIKIEQGKLTKAEKALVILAIVNSASGHEAETGRISVRASQIGVNGFWRIRIARYKSIHTTSKDVHYAKVSVA